MSQDAAQRWGRLRTQGIDAGFAFYRRYLSPALHTFAIVRGHCPYQPTCSEYAALALARYGLFRGGALTLWRLLRCNPLSRGGWDPVPPRSPQEGGSPDAR